MLRPTMMELWRITRRLGFVLMALLLTVGWPAASAPGRPPVEDVLAKADRLFQDQQWAEARAAYDIALQREQDTHARAARRALRGAAACSLKLGDWDDAWQRVRKFRQRVAAEPHER